MSGAATTCIFRNSVCMRTFAYRENIEIRFVYSSKIICCSSGVNFRMQEMIYMLGCIEGKAFSY